MEDTFPKDFFIQDDQTLNEIILFGDDNERRFPTKLKFISGNVIDVRDADPYRSLPYPRQGKDPDNLEHFYDLSALPRVEQDIVLKEARINENAFRETNYLSITTQVPRIEIADSIVVVAYHAYYYSNDEDILATEGVAIIYDEQGEEVTRITDKKDGFYDIRLSANGNYLMQKYGTNYGEDGGGQLDTGFKFYNTYTGKIIFEKSFGKDQFLDGFDFFFETNYAKYYRSKGQVFQHGLIDFLNRKVYTKNMDYDKYSNDESYSRTTFPLFLKSKKTKDLIKDGFKLEN
ncbi:MAG: hypothetical protein AAF741_00010 [Bacteroidota bacterium]